MKKVLFFLSLFLMSPIMAQEDTPYPICEPAAYWLVNDGGETVMWIYSGENNLYNGYWTTTQPKQDRLTITFDGTDVFATTIDKPCSYEGTLSSDGRTVSGTNCAGLNWSAELICGAPALNIYANAGRYRPASEQEFTFYCLPSATMGNVWGTDIYTDDSSICTAAFHAGVIGADEGGGVTITILPGQAAYEASEQNDVTSRRYAGWAGSFSVDAADDVIPVIAWNMNIVSLRGMNEKVMQFQCLPAIGVTYNVWGTDIYTDDSSVCGAAVHAGVIDLEGGEVAVQILPGQKSYTGSERNGVRSSSFGEWRGSFNFVESDEKDKDE